MELLAPAGSLDKLKYALIYGADSVYAAGKQFGLRAKAANLSNKELIEAVVFCHNRAKKLYVPINIFAHNRDIAALPSYIRFLSEIGVDAVIVSDPGVLQLVTEEAPELTIHLSTQANTTSWKAVQFWKEHNVKRVILARELSISEICEIKAKVPDIELEIFIHGAMCISYSGRCLISAFLNNRSANEGLCTHPCRWEYRLYEESRPNQYFPIEEDDRGTYILNSKDLCLFKQLPEIIDSGIDSVKIEGRMKSLYYVANSVRVYRTAIDIYNELKHSNRENDWYEDKKVQDSLIYLQEELEKVSHREWTEGFFRGQVNDSQCYSSSSYIRDYQFLGEIIGIEKVDYNPYLLPEASPIVNSTEYNLEASDTSTESYYLLLIKIRAKFSVGDKIELIFSDYKYDTSFTIDRIYDADNLLITDTKPNTTVKIISRIRHPEFGIVRKRI